MNVSSKPSCSRLYTKYRIVGASNQMIYSAIVAVIVKVKWRQILTRHARPSSGASSVGKQRGRSVGEAWAKRGRSEVEQLGTWRLKPIQATWRAECATHKQREIEEDDLKPECLAWGPIQKLVLVLFEPANRLQNVVWLE